MKHLFKKAFIKWDKQCLWTNVSAVQRGRIPPNTQYAYSSAVLFGERLVAVNQDVGLHFSSVLTHLIHAEPYPPTACKCFISFYSWIQKRKCKWY